MNLDEDLTNESLGFRDFVLTIDRCPEYCVSCDGSGCKTCQADFNLNPSNGICYYKKNCDS